MTHQARRLTARDGSRPWIDVGMTGLIRALWDAGYDTVTCCQDIGEAFAGSDARYAAYWAGYAMVQLPPPDATRLLDTVKADPLFAGRMHPADPGAWDITMQVMALPGAPTGPAPWVTIKFPASQITELTTLITEGTQP
jgi:hypothetical protein